MIEAAIFDLDGTLLDTEILWVEATWRYIEEIRGVVDHDRILEIVYGRSWRQVYEDLVRAYDLASIPIEEMELAMRRWVDAERSRRDDIILDNSVALLRELARQMPVAVISGSPKADVATGIAQMGIEDCLDFFMGAEDYNPGKPDPACFRLGLERLGVAGEHCVIFEDSNAGVSAAKGAGAWCVALARAARPKQDVSQADWVLQDLSEFGTGWLASPDVVKA